MFEKVGVNTYRREQEEQSKNHGLGWGRSEPPRRRTVKWFQVRARDVAVHLMFLAVAFFMSQGVLLGELYPFGAALVAASFVAHRIYAPSVLLGTVLGLATVTSGWDQVVNIMALVLVGVAALSLPLGLTGLRFLLGGSVFAVLVLTGTIYVTVTGATTYDYIKVLFEAIFAGLLTMAYYGALMGLQKMTRRMQVSIEELFYLALLLISIIAGAGQLQWWGVSPGWVLADLVVLLAAYIGGAGLGAAAGAVLGVLPSLIFMVAPAALGALAFAGLLGGLCRNIGRLGVVVGFMLGQALLTVYLGQGQPVAVMFVESAFAALVFLLLPRAFLTFLHKRISMVSPWGTAMERSTAEAGSWERPLADLAHVYAQISGALEESKPVCRGQQIAINELKNLVCNDCVLYLACWERDGQQTYAYLDASFEAAEKKGQAVLEDLAEPIRLRCSRVRELVLGVNCLHQQQRMSFFWENRLRDSQELVADQLRGMGEVISQICKDLKFHDKKWRGKIDFFKQELKKAGFPVASLTLYHGDGELEIEVIMPTCGRSGQCRYDLAPLLSALAGVKLAPVVGSCIHSEDEEFCSMRYCSQLRHSLKVGLARSAGRSGCLSGDHYVILPLPGGRLGMILSDGMGTGPAAATASRTTLSLLQQLLKIGFDQQLAVRILNTIMMRQFTGENFATIDLCVVDLSEGKAEIIKIGAPPSYHLNQNNVDLIGSSGSLPVGVMDEMRVFAVTRAIVAGDMLVMVTDGVTDAYREAKSGGEEEWITKVLREIVDLPPQEVADLILKLAQSGARGHRVDDMIVLVAQVAKPYSI